MKKKGKDRANILKVNLNCFSEAVLWPMAIETASEGVQSRKKYIAPAKTDTIEAAAWAFTIPAPPLAALPPSKTPIEKPRTNAAKVGKKII